MANASPLYSKKDLAYYRETYADTEFLVHVIGPDDVLLHSDINDDEPDCEPTVPFTLATADKLAAAINSFQVSEENAEYAPFMHATVFHYGRPLAAPEEIPAPAPFSYEDLAWFKAHFGAYEWVAYVHGQDEVFTQRTEDGDPFTEETVRRYAADMAVWNREHVAQGLEPSVVAVFHFGEPVEIPAVAK